MGWFNVSQGSLQKGNKKVRDRDGNVTTEAKLIGEEREKEGERIRN